ncbi:MAG: hypothetical protein DMG71_18120, partial [Acidobacteria bacterium]
MRIGWVSSALPYLPSRGGFRVSGANLIPRLARRHSVDLISLLEDDDAEHLDWIRSYCNSVVTIPVTTPRFPQRVANFISGYAFGKYLSCRPQLAAAVRSGFNDHRWNILHVEGSFVGGIVPTDLPVPKLLSVHDAEILRAQEMLKCRIGLRDRMRYTARRYYERRYERLVYPRYNRCLVLAERDLIFNRRVVPEAKWAVISQGIDIDYFRPLPVEKLPDSMVFHGHLSYPPNVHAAFEFADKIFPLIRRQRPSATFHLVGASPTPQVRELASRPGIRLSAELPDLRATLCSAQVYVCALLYGSGIKNKLLEAMSMQLPIVAYPGATVGIECTAGKHLVTADTP